MSNFQRNDPIWVRKNDGWLAATFIEEVDAAPPSVKYTLASLPGLRRVAYRAHVAPRDPAKDGRDEPNDGPRNS